MVRRFLFLYILKKFNGVVFTDTRIIIQLLILIFAGRCPQGNTCNRCCDRKYGKIFFFFKYIIFFFVFASGMSHSEHMWTYLLRSNFIGGL